MKKTLMTIAAAAMMLATTLEAQNSQCPNPNPGTCKKNGQCKGKRSGPRDGSGPHHYGNGNGTCTRK